MWCVEPASLQRFTNSRAPQENLVRIFVSPNLKILPGTLTPSAATNENEYRDASLTEFSKENNIDIYTLGRIIRKNTGKTFTQLLAQKRMRQAAYLLKNTTLSIADISVSVGYENTSYFYRLFRETYGVSPRTYRVKE